MAKRKGSLYSSSGFKFLLVTVIASFVVLGLKNFATNYQTNVLGTTSYLADRGNDNSGSGSSDSNSLDSSDDGDEFEPTDSPDLEDENEIEDQNEIEDEEDEALEEELEISQFSLENLRGLEVRTLNNRTRIRLDSSGARFELENEDGKLKIKVKHEDGTEDQLEEETLDDINDALEDEDIEIATTSGRGFLIRHGQFEAETHFPLSINPTTNELTVTTPAGTKIVAILPDSAVNNLLRQKFIDIIASESADIVLDLLNDEPAFQISGVDNQKLFGLLPVSIKKTLFVSAQTGQVVKINETFFQRLLDILSVQ